ncbi:hypothetical protein C0993_006338 [Termitomyces sp. T159_Od127]|nr:hypothetical protein C0993_006338 [Termitomyces sp. T159_Od127]
MSTIPPPTHSPPLLYHESDFSVPEAVLKGTMMTKVSEKRQKRVLFQLDPDAGRILYKSRKTGPAQKIVALETVKEIRSGSAAIYYREQFKLPEGTEKRWITIIYILDGAYKTLHIIADTHEIFVMWDAAIRKLVAIRQGLMIGLGNVDVRESIWTRQYWKGADGNGDRKLSLEEVERLCWRLNARFTRPELEKMFKDADPTSKGYLDYDGFQSFVRTLKLRPEIEQIYKDFRNANGDNFDFPSKLTQDELKAIFVKYSWTAPTTPGPKPTEGTSLPPSVAAPPPQKVPNTSQSVNQDASQSPVLNLEGFSSFLLSPENAAFSEKNHEVWQDMTRPASEYFISASHNTYLVGHQLIGVSTVEGYIRALLHSCRSVELDIYDGDTEPVVFHGKTLTSKVSVRDICNAIAKYAFVTSPYPVLISAEIHCSVKQQDILVKVMIEAFGESLIRAPVEGRPRISRLPSPEDLKGKILLKAKNLYVVAQLEALRNKSPTATPPKETEVLEADTSSSDDSEDEEETNGKRFSGEIRHGMQELKEKWRRVRGTSASLSKTKGKVKMSFNLASLLVYTVGVKCQGFGKEHGYAPEHIFSLSENKVNKLIKTGSTMRDLVQHTKDHMVRIYPKGTRVSSSNYQPHRYWAAGAQIVALNWQTFGEFFNSYSGYTINQAMFQRNGRAGFVLKPEALRGNDELLSKYSKHVLEITIVSAHQLPRLKDKRGQEVVEKSIVDPLVQVTLHIPDWTHPPFGLKTGSATSLPPMSKPGDPAPPSSRIITKRTRAVRNNGFNPIWRETLRLPFDVVGGKEMMDLVFAQISVLEDDYDEEDDEPIAMYCTPLSCLERGYRHLPLHDSQLSQYLFSTLFLYSQILDE